MGIADDEIKAKIAAINERLKAANVPVRLRLGVKSLFLRCSKLPPKSGDDPGKRYDLPQGKASASNLALMEAKAHQLWQSVLTERFSWDNHSTPSRLTETVAQWVNKFEKHHRTDSPDCSKRTFDKHWRGEVFDRLPQDVRPSSALFLSAVLKTPENTRQRRQTCQKLTKLADYIGLDIDLKPHQGSYGKRLTKPRDLPSDEQIEQWYKQIKSDPWRIIFARIVAFGLRPSESFDFELVDQYTAIVIDAKSGEPRETKAFHPRWAEQWQFEGQLPKISPRPENKHQDTSWRIANRFRAWGITGERYDLRHAWCVRIIVNYPDISDSIAARWAGHSPEVHAAIYSRWINKQQQDKVYRNSALKIDD